jgi:hypothetical protein
LGLILLLMLVERAGKATLHADDSSLGKSLIIAAQFSGFWQPRHSGNAAQYICSPLFRILKIIQSSAISGILGYEQIRRKHLPGDIVLLLSSRLGAGLPNAR